MSNHELTQQQEAAAQLIAAGELEKQQIAERLGVSRQSLWNWEQTEKFKMRLNELRRDFESFGVSLIHSKFVDAANEYWELIHTTNNDRVKAEGYRYFIDRKIGKPTSKHQIEAGLSTNEPVDEDVLDAEFEQIAEGIEEDE